MKTTKLASGRAVIKLHTSFPQAPFHASMQSLTRRQPTGLRSELWWENYSLDEEHPMAQVVGSHAQGYRTSAKACADQESHTAKQDHWIPNQSSMCDLGT